MPPPEAGHPASGVASPGTGRPIANRTTAGLAAVLALLACRSSDRSAPRAPFGADAARPTLASGGADATAAAAAPADGDDGRTPTRAAADARRAPRPVPGPRWATWPMPNPPGTHLPNPAHYSTATAEVIEDKVTGLMWQRAVDAGGYSWREAGDYCEHLALAGFTDWRLPARIELVSIIDVSRSEPSIDGVAFPATPIDRFWSSSPEAANPDGAAWTVYFQFGHAKAEPTNSPYRVRCVRTPSGGRRAAAGPAVPPYLVQDEVVRDLGTGLNWQRAAPTPSFTHQQARRYCGSLRLDRKKGWRVPTLGELLTIVDERSSPPSVDGRAFPEPATEASPVTSPRPSQWFWTSSPFADRGAMAWQVSFEYGASRHGPLKEPHRVRCVQ